MVMKKNMADRLVELREKNHLSQSAVASRLGVTSALISAYEKTERNPSLERLIALADVYHTSTDYILGRSATDSHAAIIEVRDLTDAQIRILRELIEVMRHPEPE
jgi:transcriptional regulator with XRE-family HTH domain